MKRFLLLVFFLSIFLLSFVSAQYSCDDSQTILRLSSQTNAHGAVWDYTGSGYNIEICYNRLFGQTYTGANPHSSTGTNTVVRLSSTSNAHAETPGRTNPAYFDVGYGDLECQARTANQCSSNEVEILSLSSQTGTNLHLGVPGAYSGIRICCNSPGAGQNIIRVEWRNLFNQKITSANVGSRVNLWADTTFNQGTSVTFEIWEDDQGINPDDPIRVGSEAFTANVDSNGEAKAEWLITNEDLEGQGDLDSFYIKAIASSTAESERIPISTSSVQPEPPIANIISPIDRGIYYRNTTVEFRQDPLVANQNSLRYEWTIEEDNFRSTASTFNYTFTTSGQKTVNLRLTDRTSSLSDEDQVSIVVISSPGILAFVNPPGHQQVIPELAQTSGPSRLRADFGANQSFVVNSINGNPCPTVNCLAGNCPSATQNGPGSCGPLPINSPNQGFSKTNFTWIFDDGDRIEGSGPSFTYRSKYFGEAYAKQNIVKLIFGYYDSQTGLSLKQETEREFNLGQCTDSGDTWLLINSQTGRINRKLSTQTVNGACVGQDGLQETLDDCCRTGFVCGDPGDGSNEIKCYDNVEDDPIAACADYTDENDCEDDVANIVRADPLWAIKKCGQLVNGQVIQCFCDWSTTKDKCLFNQEGINSGGGTAPIGGEEWECNLEYQQGACQEGYKVINVLATFIPPAGPSTITAASVGCVNEEYNVLCGAPVVELPFFGKQQLILTIICLLLFYLIYRKK